ncbi:MAG: hypothetical protein ACI30X_03180 [Muribaculaceae bacterium]
MSTAARVFPPGAAQASRYRSGCSAPHGATPLFDWLIRIAGETLTPASKACTTALISAPSPRIISTNPSANTINYVQKFVS